ncbi:mitochondrial proton/calcium exchanger protein-like protein isoform X1 [Tanacetum coccineum]|uniref:Mitochondrial proton/calcium exchanger protein-like protein isoform X1 n=1 Tax=Tanacetum coccineum TaxID=301880 RepID=A0ABQ5HL60_9ASTR
MDTRAIVRRRGFHYDHYNDHGRRSVQGMTYGISTMSRESSSTANNTFKHPGSTKYIGTSFKHEEFNNFTVPEVIRALKYHTIVGHTSPMSFNSVSHYARFSLSVSQSARFSSVASTPKPDLGKDKDNNEEVSKQVIKSQKNTNPILKRSWAMLLGIGPALRAVASMSRQDWAKKLVHRKTEFADTLKHYWLGIMLVGVDMKIGSRLLVKLAVGVSLSRTDRQQLTKLLGIVPRSRVRVLHVLTHFQYADINPLGENCMSWLHIGSGGLVGCAHRL